VYGTSSPLGNSQLKVEALASGAVTYASPVNSAIAPVIRPFASWAGQNWSWTNLSITAMVAYWYQNPGSNNGFRVSVQTNNVEGGGTYITTSNATGGGGATTLWITYDQASIVPASAPLYPLSVPTLSKRALRVDTTTPWMNTTPIAANAAGEAPQYLFEVSPTPSFTGTVYRSGWQATTSIFVPAGILERGSTYWWRAVTRYPSATATYGYPPNCTPTACGARFQVDGALADNGLKASDSFGGVDVNLKTGNATISVGTKGVAGFKQPVSFSMTNNSLRTPSSAVSLTLTQSSPPNGSQGLTVPTPTIGFNAPYGGSPGGGVNGWFEAVWRAKFRAPATGAYYFRPASFNGWYQINVDGVIAERTGQRPVHSWCS
jgi:hypothetical protein